MGNPLDFASYALPLLFKAVLLAARWAGGRRRRAIEELARMGEIEKEREILLLRDKASRLEALVRLLQRQLAKGPHRPRYTLEERLCILWHLEVFQVPRRRVQEYFGVARSTLYRWLHQEEEQPKPARRAVNKTPEDLAALVLEIAEANPQWGRFRIAAQLSLLRIFLSVSAVRSILQRPKPRKPKAPAAPETPGPLPAEASTALSIQAWYPNHVWSVDLTVVLRWGIWPTYLLLAIDHYSRKIVAVKSLEGPNSGWAIEALQEAFRNHGSPKHVISDQGVPFTSKAFMEFIKGLGIKQRFGAVGKHGSIAVTERAIETLKCEWLRRVPLIRGFDHLEVLCDDFALWYNRFRPHLSLGGRIPEEFHKGSPIPPRPAKTDKKVPQNIRTRRFEEARVTAFFLEDTA